MKLSLIVSLGAAVASASFHNDALLKHFAGKLGDSLPPVTISTHQKPRTAAPEPSHRFLTDKTRKFAVNGSAFPDVPFNIGESYAGQLPISNKTDEESNLFFWFFPSANEDARNKKEIAIWLNGGPGCSSLIGLALENGPFVWMDGRDVPEQNPWSWHLLTNVVYIDQPTTVGFSTGKPTANDEDTVAQQFMGFWKNFYDMFDLHDYKVYLTGESYAGMYGPYIGSNMINAKDKTYFDVGGLLVFDGSAWDFVVQAYVPQQTFGEQWSGLLLLPDPTRDALHKQAQDCGFYDFEKQFLQFPPHGPMPLRPPGWALRENGTAYYRRECDILMGQTWNAYAMANPCLDQYDIRSKCPSPTPHIMAEHSWFNRPEVKAAIHAPNKDWSPCVDGALTGYDDSDPASVKVLPHVIDATQNVIFSHGATDMLLKLNGMMLGIQNMTWGGKLGFQQVPSDPFYVPLVGQNDGDGRTVYGKNLPGGGGVLGTTHTERGFTMVALAASGHEAPMLSPAAALRQLEKLLGRVASFTEVSPFTLPQLKNATQLSGPLGKGVVKIGCIGKECVGP